MEKTTPKVQNNLNRKRRRPPTPSLKIFRDQKEKKNQNKSITELFLLD
jgi:hypothetical protein